MLEILFFTVPGIPKLALRVDFIFLTAISALLAYHTVLGCFFLFPPWSSSFCAHALVCSCRCPIFLVLADTGRGMTDDQGSTAESWRSPWIASNSVCW